MKCVICKNGETRPGTTTVTLQRKETTIIIKDVSAEICDNCGEYYLSEEITEKVMMRAEAAVRNGAEVEIIRFKPKNLEKSMSIIT
jgi:YgiT-type zinc finger domain-containing protein